MSAKLKEYRPTEKEPFMNEKQRDYFRDKLLAWKEDILKEARETLQRITRISPIARPPKPTVRSSCALATVSAS
jgi:hypothetical protein